MYVGYVALLDVLGFSNLIAADDSGQRVERYLACLTESTLGTAVDFVVFSDSIVLTIGNDEPDGLIKLARACSRLMHDLLLQDIPIRGSISRGPFLRSRVGENVFVAGRAVIEAYQFEQEQDWIGVMLAPSVVSGIPDLAVRCSLQRGAWNGPLMCNDVKQSRSTLETRFIMCLLSTVTP